MTHLTRAETDTLIALSLVAPATLPLVDVTREISCGSHMPLAALMRKGLVTRKTTPPPPALSKEEVWSGKKQRAGKRPHLYDMTESGKTVAHHLVAIRNELRSNRCQDDTDWRVAK